MSHHLPTLRQGPDPAAVSVSSPPGLAVDSGVQLKPHFPLPELSSPCMAGTIWSGVRMTLAPLRLVASSQAARSCSPGHAEGLHPHPVPAAASEQCLGRSHTREHSLGRASSASVTESLLTPEMADSTPEEPAGCWAYSPSLSWVVLSCQPGLV